ncbi:hypothetical protein PHYPSEUDO_007179 [Phytophthora pseudosyringae]|uniref:Roc domain-containing protein n=1 Tax=Phytophthora pseudosyringae TaxID=221518 RepID=A0A8T1VGP9_9STRA|nr:hypothetical protein PHYPSEUDO_007179 [Phytophthora pseudosyringae]
MRGSDSNTDERTRQVNWLRGCIERYQREERLLWTRLRLYEASAVMESVKRGDANESQLHEMLQVHWRKQKLGRKPLTKIPVEEFRRGAAKVQKYLDEYEDSETIVVRSKICVVGPSTWGKTSLVKTLTTGTSTVENEEDRTIGIDLFNWTFDGSPRDGKERKYEITFWDFGGQDVYRGAYSIFYSQRTLFLLCVDLAQYAQVLDNQDESELAQFFKENILCWFRLVRARQFKTQIVLVGTKADEANLNSDSIRLVAEDVGGRLKDWIEENNREIQSTTGKQTVGNGFQIPWLITSSKNSVEVEQIRQELQEIVVGKTKEDEQGFAMPVKYVAVLKYVRELREQTQKFPLEDKLKSIFRNDKALRCELGKKLTTNRPTMDECKPILLALHDLGDLLYFDKENFGILSNMVILDPHVIVDLVRQIVCHDHSEKEHVLALQTKGFVPHALLKTLPLWNVISDELTVALKELLQHFRMAYLAGQSRMTPEALHETVSRRSLRYQKELKDLLSANDHASEGVSSHVCCWEYEFPGDTLPDSIFEEIVIESYYPGADIFVLSDAIDLRVKGSFAARLALQVGSWRSKIRVEAVAYEGNRAWRAMRFFVRAVELVLERFPGVDVVRYVGDGHSEHHNLEKVLRDSNTGEWFETPAVRPEWMPMDSDIRKAKAAEHQLNLMDNKIDVLQRIAIVGEDNRELPAIWTAERVHTRTGFTIRVKMLSDLSCQCFHRPIDIDALPEVIGACGKWIQVGLSIFSTVAPSKWIVSSSDLRAAFGIDKVLDQTVNIHNLIQGTDSKTNGFIDTSADSRLDSQQSRDLLRKLLEISCGRFEPRDVPSLSGLECGIVEASGVHVCDAR